MLICMTDNFSFCRYLPVFNISLNGTISKRFVISQEQTDRTHTRAAESFPPKAIDDGWRAIIVRRAIKYSMACGGGRGGEQQGGTTKWRRRGKVPDTLLIRDRRSPLHSRCTAGDSSRPSRSLMRWFPLTAPHCQHPAYAISHSGELLFFPREGNGRKAFFAVQDSLKRNDRSVMAVPNVLPE